MNCEPFEQINQKFVLLFQEYKYSFRTMLADAESRAVKTEYSKGGSTIHRGFYSPSALDLVTGGNSRGRLCKNMPKDNRYNYEYTFDENGNMVSAKKYEDSSKGELNTVSIELFLYENERVLSFEFDPYGDYLPVAAHECTYEQGLLSRYESAFIHLGCTEASCFEIHTEAFGYENGLLKTDLYHCYMPLVGLLTGNNYSFYRDADGYISTFGNEELTDLCSKSHGSDSPRQYKVKVRRK